MAVLVFPSAPSSSIRADCTCSYIPFPLPDERRAAYTQAYLLFMSHTHVFALHRLSLSRTSIYSCSPPDRISSSILLLNIQHSTHQSFTLYSTWEIPSPTATTTINQSSDTTSHRQDVLSSRRTLLGVPLSLLQTLDRPMPRPRTARSHCPGEDGARGLRLCKPQQPSTRNRVHCSRCRRPARLWICQRRIPHTAVIAP